MLKVECSSPYFKLLEPTRPEFGLFKSIPEGIAPQIEVAVRDFMVSSHLPQGVDPEGFYRQTLQGIAAASYLNQGGELWLGVSRGTLWTYILGNVSNDVDGKLCYVVRQAWVRKDQRGQKWVKDAWQMVRKRAKDCLCSHLIVYSSRGNDKAYCRFLGKGFHPFETLLKEEI